MYTIYYNDRFLTLSKEPDITQNYAIVINYSLLNSISEAIKIVTNSESGSVNLYSDNLEELWNNFRSQYTEAIAAGGLVSNNNGEYLIMHRRGRIDLPKGHLELGETIEECALREVGEECGINGHSIIKPLSPTYHTYSEKGKQILKTTYWYLMKYSGELPPTPQTEEDISEVKFVSRQEIASLIPKAWHSLHPILRSL